jgi:hypothetical protein
MLSMAATNKCTNSGLRRKAELAESSIKAPAMVRAQMEVKELHIQRSQITMPKTVPTATSRRRLLGFSRSL